jgi:hypothetical protein
MRVAETLARQLHDAHLQLGQDFGRRSLSSTADQHPEHRAVGSYDSR